MIFNDERIRLKDGATIYDKGSKNKYKIISAIASGGSSLIYAADNISCKPPTRVVLKEIYPSPKNLFDEHLIRGKNGTTLEIENGALSNSKSIVDRMTYYKQKLKWEAEITNKISVSKKSESLLPSNLFFQSIGGYFEANETAYFAVRSEQGQSLSDYIKSKKSLNMHEIIQITQSILEGVKTLHDQEILHIDLSPENIYISETDNNVRAYIIDLNSSIDLHNINLINNDPNKSYMEKEHDIKKEIETVCFSSREGYSSLELFRLFSGNFRNPEISEKIDLYSVTCILYYMLFNEEPSFRKIGRLKHENIEIRYSNDVQLIDATTAVKLQENLYYILHKGTCDYQKRYSKAAEMIREFKIYSDLYHTHIIKPPSPVIPPPPPSPPPPPPHKKLIVLLIFLLVLFLSGVTLYAAYNLRDGISPVSIQDTVNGQTMQSENNPQYETDNPDTVKYIVESLIDFESEIEPIPINELSEEVLEYVNNIYSLLIKHENTSIYTKPTLDSVNCDRIISLFKSLPLSFTVCCKELKISGFKTDIDQYDVYCDNSLSTCVIASGNDTEINNSYSAYIGETPKEVYKIDMLMINKLTYMYIRYYKIYKSQTGDDLIKRWEKSQINSEYQKRNSNYFEEDFVSCVADYFLQQETFSISMPATKKLLDDLFYGGKKSIPSKESVTSKEPAVDTEPAANTEPVPSKEPASSKESTFDFENGDIKSWVVDTLGNISNDAKYNVTDSGLTRSWYYSPASMTLYPTTTIILQDINFDKLPELLLRDSDGSKTTTYIYDLSKNNMPNQIYKYSGGNYTLRPYSDKSGNNVLLLRDVYIISKEGYKSGGNNIGFNEKYHCVSALRVSDKWDINIDEMLIYYSYEGTSFLRYQFSDKIENLIGAQNLIPYTDILKEEYNAIYKVFFGELTPSSFNISQYKIENSKSEKLNSAFSMVINQYFKN